MSKDELLQLNGAIDEADRELMVLINHAVWGKAKKE